MSRVLAEDSAFDGLDQQVYPDGAPARVDWIDYRTRYERANPAEAVERYEEIAAQNTNWLIWSSTYPPTQGACTNLFNQLQATRPDRRLIVEDDSAISDHESLWAFQNSS